MPPMTPALLKTEVTTNPALTTWWADGTLGLILDFLNAQTVTATKADRTVTPVEFVASLVWTEYAALTQEKRDYLALLSRTTFVYKGDVKDALIAIFPVTGAGTTRSNLNKIIDRNVSRAEELWGVGTRVTLEDLAAARIA